LGCAPRKKMERAPVGLLARPGLGQHLLRLLLLGNRRLGRSRGSRRRGRAAAAAATHGNLRQLLGALLDELLEVLALELAADLREGGVVALGADRRKNLLHVSLRGGGVAAKDAKEVCGDMLHFDRLLAGKH